MIITKKQYNEAIEKIGDIDRRLTELEKNWNVGSVPVCPKY